jgi:hypothetical protein
LLDLTVRLSNDGEGTAGKAVRDDGDMMMAYHLEEMKAYQAEVEAKA